MTVKDLISVNDALGMGDYLEFFHTIGDIELDDLNQEELIQLCLDLRARQTDNIDSFAAANTKAIHKIISHINKKYLNPKKEKLENPILMHGKHQVMLNIVLTEKQVTCLKLHSIEFPADDIEDVESFFQLCCMGFYVETSKNGEVWFLPTLMYNQFISKYTV